MGIHTILEMYLKNYKSWTEALKQYLYNKVNIPVTKQYMVIMHSDANKMFNRNGY